MKILALDTSSRAASCALSVDGTLAGESFLNAGLTHSQTMMPMVESLLRCGGFSLGDVDLFAVSTGPGSFTGLRIGIAAVKGMAAALDKPCAGVSTLEGLAWGLSDCAAYLVPVLDARRSQVYTALFRGEGGRVKRLEEDKPLSLDALEARLTALEAGPKILVGDGARLCMDHMEERIPGLRMAAADRLHQRAASLCRVAEELAARGETVTAGELVPRYLRLPQAERERLAKEKKDNALGG